MSEQEQKKIFAKNLAYYIGQSGKQQKEIAAELGISPTTFNTWCVGKIIPSMGKVQKIADYFHIGKTDLLEERGEHYYLNDDARDMAQFMYDNPEYKVLFDASRKVSKDDIELVAKLIDKFKSQD